jgi:hypothetical protein
MGEPPLEKCPKCGREVEKCISGFSLATCKTNLDDRARAKGLHKLKRLGGGEYEKVY